MNHRMPDNYPLRSVVVAGNLMAAALEHADLYEAMEIDSLILTWHGALARAPVGSVPDHIAGAGNGIASALTSWQYLRDDILASLIYIWRASINVLRKMHTHQQEAA
jgi:hypothetical protein